MKTGIERQKALITHPAAEKEQQEILETLQEYHWARIVWKELVKNLKSRYFLASAVDKTIAHFSSSGNVEYSDETESHFVGYGVPNISITYHPMDIYAAQWWTFPVGVYGDKIYSEGSQKWVSVKMEIWILKHQFKKPDYYFLIQGLGNIDDHPIVLQWVINIGKEIREKLIDLASKEEALQEPDPAEVSKKKK